MNWLDKNGSFLGAEITPIPCSDEYDTHTRVVRSPADAATGVVYATGHSGADKVEYKSLSFR